MTRRPPKLRSATLFTDPVWRDFFVSEFRGALPCGANPEKALHWQHGLSFDDELLCAAWQVWRDEVLAQWIHQHPGTRPRMWWAVDALEPRRLISGEINGSGASAVLCGGLDGFPQFRCVAGEEPVFESQFAYLRRLDLLIPAEQNLDLPAKEVYPIPMSHRRYPHCMMRAKQK